MTPVLGHLPNAGAETVIDESRVAPAVGRERHRSSRYQASRSFLLLTIVLGFAVAANAVDGLSAATTAHPAPFSFTFAGNPAAPEPWKPSNWDVVVNSRDLGTFAHLEGMQAQHGSDCSPYPATHFNNTYDGAVFICRNHVMTAINAGGYGEIVLTPDHMVDFSSGDATIRFDISTLRTSLRDWVDVWITPFDDNLVLPLDFHVDLQGPPARAIQVKMDSFNGTVFRAFQYENFQSRELPNDFTKSIEQLEKPSATTRTTFELTISRTHLKFGAPALGYNWINAPLNGLTWTRALVQLAHHSYNPTKDCKDQGFPVCLPNTWHWSSFYISSAVPFSLLRGDPQVVHAGAPAVVNFPAAAPQSAFLRFAAIGSIEVSRDGGKTWQPANRQAQQYHYDEHFSSYWTPVPAGTRSITIRGHDWFAGPWWVRDIAIWSATPLQNTRSPTSTAPSATVAPSSAASSSTPPSVVSPAGGSRPATRNSRGAMVASPVGRWSVAILAFLLAAGVGYLVIFIRRRRQQRRS